MREFLAACLVVVACAPAERAGEESVAARYAGMWHGRSYVAEGDTGVMWINTMSVDAEGNLVGTLEFSGGPSGIAVRTVEFTDSTFVQDVGPYTSPTAGAEVRTRVEGWIRGDSIFGTFAAVPTAGGDTIRGRFAAGRM